MKSKQERVKSLLLAGSMFVCFAGFGAVHYASITYLLSLGAGVLIAALFIKIYYARPENVNKTTSPAMRSVLMLTFFFLMFVVGPRLRETFTPSPFMGEVMTGFTSGAFLILVFGSALMIHRSIREN